MRPRIVRTVCAALLAVFVPARAGLPETIARVKPAVVAVGTELPTRSPRQMVRGTGFVVDDGLSVVTNAHVVAGELDVAGKERLVVLTSSPVLPVRGARVRMLDMEHDLALLSVDGPPLPAFVLGDGGEVREGMEVAFTGFPLGTILGLQPVTHRGIVSAITPVASRPPAARALTAPVLKGLERGYTVLQLDARAYPGNSGSPLYHPGDGRLLGVVNSVLVRRSKEAQLLEPSGITYAIPVDFVARLIAAARRAPGP